MRTCKHCTPVFIVDLVEQLANQVKEVEQENESLKGRIGNALL